MSTPIAFSDHSDEDGTFPGDRAGSDHSSRRRSTRACDHCRRTKSKCERAAGPDRPCRGCTTLGLSCTYAGPSHKRGPPKGYIHAIERRLHQAEALLGAIIGCQDHRARSLLETLSRDPVAQQIIRRVEHGPFGPKGRTDGPFASTKQDFLTSISKSIPDDALDGPVLTKRQSRMSREELTASLDNQILVTPSSSWGDSLKDMLNSDADIRLSHSPSSVSSRSPVDTASTAANRVPLAIDRKASDDSLCSTQGFTQLAYIDPDEMSPDDNAQLRYYGKASAFYLLQKCASTGTHRNPLELAAQLSLTQLQSPQYGDVLNISMPQQHVQNTLIEFYFDSIHPMFPVVHKRYFFEMYEQRMRNLTSTGPTSADLPFQFLLFAIFSLSARFSHVDSFSVDSSSRETYHMIAMELFHNTMNTTCPMVCQALLLMGYYDLGVGSGSWAAVFIDIAISMARSLGMHRSPESLKHSAASFLSKSDQELRLQIWTGCAILDRFAAAFTGRTMAIRPLDSDVPASSIGTVGDEMQRSPSAFKPPFRTSSNMINQYLDALGRLSNITSTIIEAAYPNAYQGNSTMYNAISQIEDALEKWYLELPSILKLESDRTAETAPVVLLLHAQYWWACIVLHRGFIRVEEANLSGRLESPLTDTLRARAVSQCQNAASRVVSIASVWYSKYSLARVSPFLLGPVLDAAAIFLVVLKSQPWNPHTRLSLQQCQTVLAGAKDVWPMAQTISSLLDRTVSTIEAALAANIQISAPLSSAIPSYGESYILQSGPEASTSALFSLPSTASTPYSPIDTAASACNIGGWRNLPTVNTAMTEGMGLSGVPLASWPEPFITS